MDTGLHMSDNKEEYGIANMLNRNVTSVFGEETIYTQRSL